MTFVQVIGGVPARSETANLDTLTARGHLLPERTLYVIVPAEVAVHCWLAVPPARRRRDRLRAVPYVLEDVLASDVESLHIVTGLVGTETSIEAIGIDARWLHGWINALAARGLCADEAYAEGQLVRDPVHALMHLVIDGSRWLFRCPTAGVAGACDSQAAPEIVARMLAAPDLSGPIACVHAGPDDAPPEWLKALASDAAALDVVDVSSACAAPLTQAWLAAQAAASPPTVGLLQGRFAQAARGAARIQIERGLNVVAAAAALLIAFNVGLGLWQDSQADHQRARAVDLFRKAFPAETRVVDLRRQVNAQLRLLEAAPRPTALQRLAQTLTPLSADGSTEDRGVQSLVYTATSDKLEASILFPNVDAADRFRSAFTDAAWQAQLLTTEDSEGAVLASFVWKGPEASP
jgi:general secretion pathway protein L